LFVILTPSEASDITKPEENAAKNTFIPLMWFFFTGVLICFILICIPLFNLWVLTLIPQRVDSRAQKEFYERQEKSKEIEIVNERINIEKSKVNNEEAQKLLLQHAGGGQDNRDNRDSRIDVQPGDNENKENDVDNINNIDNMNNLDDPEVVLPVEDKQEINANNNQNNAEPSRTRLQKLRRKINNNQNVDV